MNAPSYASSAAVAGAKEPNSGEYRLRDELAQFCLPAANRDVTRKFAWANSICFLFLLIGLIGLKPPEMVIRKVEHVDEVVPAVFEPPPIQQTVETEQPPEENNNDTTEAPQIVTIVAADPSAASFAVPVQGATMVAPAHLASAPPLRTAPPKVSTAPKIKEFVGGTGRYPDPMFLANIIPSGAEAVVVVEWEVDERGKLVDIKIKESSAYPAWDKNVLETMRRKWVFTAADAGRWQREFAIKAQ